jgi:hypothetical protein
LALSFSFARSCVALQKHHPPVTTTQSQDAPSIFQFTVRASYIEIYMEKIRDLLGAEKMGGGQTLNIMQAGTGLWVTDAAELPVRSVMEALGVLRQGNLVRASGETST